MPASVGGATVLIAAMLAAMEPGHACRVSASDRWRRVARRRMRGVAKLLELARQHEAELLADVDREVAHPLDGAGGEDHVHRPFARVGVVAALPRELEDA